MTDRLSRTADEGSTFFGTRALRDLKVFNFQFQPSHGNRTRSQWLAFVPGLCHQSISRAVTSGHPLWLMMTSGVAFGKHSESSVKKLMARLWGKI